MGRRAGRLGRWQAGCVLATALAAAGCGSETADATDAGPARSDGGGAGGAGGGTGGAGGAVVLPPVTRADVSGVLTFSQAGHILSADVNGGLQQRLTARAGPWTYHAVSPDARRLVAVAEVPGEPRAVYVINVRDQSERRVSPEGCDAGIGGVGWVDDTRVLYAMSCGGEPSHLYQASTLTTPASADDLFRVDPHPEPVRDAFPAVRTPVFAYVLDREVCGGGRCITKPEVWVGESDGNHCRLSDGGAALMDGPAGVRLGDHSPSFDDTLSAVVFSRNVGGKPVGPEGHFDLMRVGFDLNALLRGAETCTTGATVNLSSTLLSSESYPDGDGADQVGSERAPDAAAGRGPAGSVLYTSEVGDAPVRRSLWVVDPGGNRTELTPGAAEVGVGRWIVDQYGQP